MKPQRPLKFRIISVSSALMVVLIFSGLLGISIGSSSVSVSDAFKALLKCGDFDPMLSVIIWKIRLPRVILAACTGATLSLGGLVFQALLRNPLAEPYILGISGGSAVGAIAGMLLGMANFPGTTVTSFAGGLLSIALVMGMGGKRPGVSKEKLLLGGVMMNAFCGAGIMLLIFLSEDSQIHRILFWLMGDLSMASPDMLPVLLLNIPLFGIIFLFSRPMNVLMTGRENALSLGINEQQVSFTLLLVTSLMISLVVTQSGLIGFVGLVIPHMLRILLGADHRVLIPAGILGGGAYLIICDTLARSVYFSGEMPVGIITAMVGAPVFIILLRRRDK